MFCHNCGKEVREGQQFCPSCGTQQIPPTQDAPVTPQPGQQQPPQQPYQQPYQQQIPFPVGFAPPGSPPPPPPGRMSKKPPGPQDRKGMWIIIAIIVAVIVVVAAIAIPVAISNSNSHKTAPIEIDPNTSNSQNLNADAAARTCKSNLRTIEAAIQTWYVETEQWPTSLAQMAAPGENQVLKKVPTCPSGGKYIFTTSTTGGEPSVRCTKHGSL
jgi:zinc-ribbon domain